MKSGKSNCSLLKNYKVLKLTKLCQDRQYIIFKHTKKLETYDIIFSCSEFLNLSWHEFYKWLEQIWRMVGTHFSCNLVICLPDQIFFLIIVLLLFGHPKIIFMGFKSEEGFGTEGQIEVQPKYLHFWPKWGWRMGHCHVGNLIHIEFDSQTISSTNKYTKLSQSTFVT